MQRFGAINLTAFKFLTLLVAVLEFSDVRTLSIQSE